MSLRVIPYEPMKCLTKALGWTRDHKSISILGFAEFLSKYFEAFLSLLEVMKNRKTV